MAVQIFLLNQVSGSKISVCQFINGAIWEENRSIRRLGSLDAEKCGTATLYPGLTSRFSGFWMANKFDMLCATVDIM